MIKMITLEPDKNDIIDELNELALQSKWGTIDRIAGKPKTVVIIQKAIQEIIQLRMQTKKEKE